MKIGHKVLIANPIGIFLVKLPGSPKTQEGDVYIKIKNYAADFLILLVY